MSDFLSRLNSGDLCGVLVVVASLVFALAVIGVSGWFKLRKSEIAANLKHDMLSRGMSAEEIRTVLEAGGNSQAGMRKG